jgi:hypothetical protein
MILSILGVASLSIDSLAEHSLGVARLSIERLAMPRLIEMRDVAVIKKSEPRNLFNERGNHVMFNERET